MARVNGRNSAFRMSMANANDMAPMSIAIDRWHEWQKFRLSAVDGSRG